MPSRATPDEITDAIASAGAPVDPVAAFLRAFHAAHPGVTTAAYARGRAVGDGRSSYELLADHAPPGARVLDLGCGDGWLLARLGARGHAPARLCGVDLSRAELAAARARLDAGAAATAAARTNAGPDARVALLAARAEALPLAAASIDACLSHLAFVLVPDAAAVAAELARVIAPGGVFATVTGGGPVEPPPGAAPADQDAFAWLLAAAAPHLARVPAARRAPRMGDRRARSADGLASVLVPAGFAAPTWAPHTIDLAGAPDEVWATLASIYELAALDAAARAALRADFAAWCAGRARVPCAMRVAVAAAIRLRR